MSGDDVTSILKDQEKLEQVRAPWTDWWQQIAQRVMPSQAQFNRTDSEGVKRVERLFSGKAVVACERFAAVMEDLLTPRTQTWCELKPADTNLEDNSEVKRYLEQVNRVLFGLRYRPEANFAAQKQMGYGSVGAFGNSALFVDEEVGKGPVYSNRFLNELYWAEDEFGRVNTIYRKYHMQARNIVKRFKEKTPPKIAADVAKNPFNTWDLLHCVRPNDERVSGRLDYRGMPWSSYYVGIADKAIIDVGGYTSWPYAIGRYMLGANETYARSPAMACWGSILTLNEEKKTILRAGQKEVDPPILLSEDGVLGEFSLASRALNYGAVSRDGQLLAQPLKTGANIPLGMELMQLEESEIEDAFLISIFKVLTENPQMTATQVLEIAQQKGVLLAPTMGRQHSEDLGPLIARELDLAAKANMLPPMPEVLAAAGGQYRIEYKSPLARAMRAAEGAAIARTFELLPQAIQVDPHAVFVFDAQEAIRVLADINGVPAKLVRDKDEVAQLIAQSEQQQQLQQAVAAAPALSQSALNAAQAQKLSQPSP